MKLLKRNLAMASNINDLIHVFDDSLEPEICKELIFAYESSSDNQERFDLDGKPNFTQYNLTKNCKNTERLNEIHNYVISKVLKHKRKYYEFIDARCFPEKHNFEQFRIKKYNNDGVDKFDTHVDVIDYESSRRFLSFFWYLNDVNEGGETVFQDLVIKPKTGRMVVFPPLWMFPHRGNPPISNQKYLLSTYLHYI